MTLSEAYEYAYARTVAETAETAAGAQHPTFSYDLKGNGNLVLAELGRGPRGPVPARRRARRHLLPGRRRPRRGQPPRCSRSPNVDRVIALAAGRYQVKRRLPDRLRIGQVRGRRAGRFVTLDEASLRDAPFSDDPVKGGARRAGHRRFGLSVGATVQAFFDAPTRAGAVPAHRPAGRRAAAAPLLPPRLGLGRRPGRGQHAAPPWCASPSARALPFRFAELDVGTSLFAEWPLLGRAA